MCPKSPLEAAKSGRTPTAKTVRHKSKDRPADFSPRHKNRETVTLATAAKGKPTKNAGKTSATFRAVSADAPNKIGRLVPNQENPHCAHQGNAQGKLVAQIPHSPGFIHPSLAVRKAHQRLAPIAHPLQQQQDYRYNIADGRIAGNGRLPAINSRAFVHPESA